MSELVMTDCITARLAVRRVGHNKERLGFCQPANRRAAGVIEPVESGRVPVESGRV
jgi:hypothetical protein